MKLATSVSITSLAVPIGGEVNVALLINPAYELFGFVSRPGVDVTQQTFQRERTAPDQVWRIGGRLRGHTTHLDRRTQLQF